MTNINFKQFEDEFGNIIQEFEVIKYEKYANGEWMEVEKVNSGRTYFNVNGKLIYKISNSSSFELNMDFNSENCGFCYVIGENIDNKKKITGNFILGTYKPLDKKFTLNKQTYSDNTAFYTIKDSYGNWELIHGNKDINELIKQLEHENIIYSENAQDYNKDSYTKIIEMNNSIIQVLKNELKEVA